MFALSFLLILPNNIGYGQWTIDPATFKIFTGPDKYVGIGPFTLTTPQKLPSTKLHLFYPDASYLPAPCIQDLRNSLLLETGFPTWCNSFAEFGISKMPNNPMYSILANEGDAIIRTYGDCSHDLIIKSENGKLRFSTNYSSVETEKFRISSDGYNSLVDIKKAYPLNTGNVLLRFQLTDATPSATPLSIAGANWNIGIDGYGFTNINLFKIGANTSPNFSTTYFDNTNTAITIKPNNDIILGNPDGNIITDPNSAKVNICNFDNTTKFALFIHQAP